MLQETDFAKTGESNASLIGIPFEHSTPTRVNMSWPNIKQVILINESIKLTFFALLIVIFSLVCCKECGLCKGMWRKLAQYCALPEDQEPLTANHQLQEQATGDPDNIVVITDSREVDDLSSPRAAGDRF